jgi:putative phosphoribosyl transferase
VGRLEPAASMDVVVSAGTTRLEGDLIVPAHARGIVVFAHGSGSSRHSPRNRRVGGTLNDVGLATLLVDLLTPDEDAINRLTAQHRFDIQLLAERLTGIVDWVGGHAGTAGLRIGLFGASTGAAAALVTAAARSQVVDAVVSRGGRPDLAGSALAAVLAPTLLIVGGADPQVLALNRRALELLGTNWNELVVVPGATHLFEQRGALEQVASLAAGWFSRHLGSATSASGDRPTGS